MPAGKIKQILQQLRNRDTAALARAITIAENSMRGADELLTALSQTGKSKIIGITGPPGAGKSTLVNQLISYWTAQGKTVAVLAVDPSSPFNKGALLGDRIRMSSFYTHPNVFIRSLATRGALGGLHPRILEICDVVKEAGYDFVIVETVGVGQSEIEISGLADCTVLVLVPEAGDGIQLIKSGIVEVADIFLLNKSDRPEADTMLHALHAMLHERSEDKKQAAVVKTEATTGVGIEAAAKAIEDFLSSLTEKPDRQAYLLTEKAWAILAQQRMAAFDKAEMLLQIRKAMNREGFNLYTFIDVLAKTVA